MTIDPTLLLVAIALLDTHPSQPKARQVADRLQRVLDQLPTDPKETER